MKFKTRGIVFNHIKFRESSIIARLYTDEFGLKNYLVNQVRSAKPRYPASFFQPLTQLEMIVYNKPHAEINRVSEIRCTRPYQSIPFDVTKTTVCLFLTEILYKVLREEDPHPQLYDFMSESFYYYDMEKKPVNFHLQFLTRLTGFLGISPADAEGLINEMHSAEQLPDTEKILFNAILKNSYSEPVKLGNKERRKFLALIIQFYQHHFDHLNEIKSYRVLKEIFD